MKTVLIAEDNDLLAQLWKHALRTATPCEVLVARDGEEACAMARERNLDLILMDIMMPKVDGLEAFRRIIHDGTKTPPPVLFVSCLARSADIEEAHRMKAVDFLVKGRFSVQNLIDRVHRILDTRPLPLPAEA